jgi:hypothetical protein
MVEVHKMIVSPQNDLKKDNLNDHYIYEISFLIVFFSLNIHIHFD